MPELEDVPAMMLSQLATPLSESDRIRLTEFWSQVITECGADLPSRREVPARPVRRARRVERQRSSRLVQVVSSAQSMAFAGTSGVAAA